MSAHAQQDNHTVRMENDLYRLDVASGNGAIVRIYDKVGELDLIMEPTLADNFRICMALPGFEGKYIHGKEQHLTSVDQSESAMTLAWDGPLKDRQGTAYDGLSATMRIELVEKRIQFQLDGTS